MNTPHRERDVYAVASTAPLVMGTAPTTGPGWIAKCTCGFQTRVLPTEDAARTHLDDHITYLTRVGENAPVPR